MRRSWEMPPVVSFLGSTEVWSRASLGLCLLVRFLLEASFFGDPSFGVLRRVSGVNPHLVLSGVHCAVSGVLGDPDVPR